MSVLATHLDALRKKIFETEQLKPYAEQLENKTKINVEYFALALGGVLLLCVFSGFCASMIIFMVGFTYPAYASIRAIESSSTDDDKQWLTYWVVFAIFCFLENISDWILYWIPFYHPLKLSFLIYCMLPQFQGAKVTNAFDIFMSRVSCIPFLTYTSFAGRSKSSARLFTEQY